MPDTIPADSSGDHQTIQSPHRRVIDPVTAVGALILLSSITFLVTYLALIVPTKLAARSGPPVEFLLAATEGAAITSTMSTPLSDETAVTASPTDEPSMTSTSATLAEENASGSVENPFSGSIIQFDPTANPRGNWPLPDYVDVAYWMSIPAINLEAPIIALAPREQDYGGVTLMRLPVPNSYSIAWDVTSAAPYSGGNIVMTGHNNLYGGVFQNLQYLQAGQEIAIWSEYGVLSYYVTEVIYLPEDDQEVEVRVQNAGYLDQVGSEMLTLITCWPNEQSTHRLIVIARP